MFRNLFNKSSQPRKKKPKVIYEEYRSLLRDKLLPLRFDGREGSGLGNYSVFKRESLELTLAFDLRDDATYIRAHSGKKAKYKTVLDQLPEEIRKKAVNLKEAEEFLVDKSDISLTLSGTDEEKASVIQTLDKWLEENQ